VLTLAQLGDYFLDMSRTDEDTSLRQLWANLAADVDSYMAGHGPADAPPRLEINVATLRDHASACVLPSKHTGFCFADVAE
jgi:hypothetical protein